MSLKKAVLAAAVTFGLLGSCFADPMFFSVKSTPYDNQMSRIQPVLASGARNDGQVSLTVVNHWMNDLRAIPYGFTMEWKTPSEVENGRAADCKGKAVALLQRMQAHGATNVRLVIGRAKSSSRSTHAWLAWQTSEGSYVLDPTMNWTAFKAADLRSNTYIPLFAYEGSHKFRAAGNSLVAQN